MCFSQRPLQRVQCCGYSSEQKDNANNESNPGTDLKGSPSYDNAFRVQPARKVVSTVVGDLPLSPVMDTLFFRQRDKWRLKKPASSDTTGKQQRRLARNPYGEFRTQLHNQRDAF